jgi:hypothetical protein
MKNICYIFTFEFELFSIGTINLLIGVVFYIKLVKMWKNLLYENKVKYNTNDYKKPQNSYVNMNST